MNVTLPTAGHGYYLLVDLNIFALLRWISQWAWSVPILSKLRVAPPATTSMPPAPPYKPKRRALLIGIASEGQPGALKGAHDDVKRMRAFLREKYAYSPPDIMCLIDAPGYEQPTRENILKHLDLLVDDAKPQDHFYFHYSGHSNQEETDDVREEDRMNEFLDISDTEKILDDELRERLVDRLPPGSSLTAVFDSCHSGTLLDLAHYHCNAVYLPFVNKGIRGTKDNWRFLKRHNAGVYPNTPNTPSPRTPFARRAALRRLSILNDARANRLAAPQPQVLPVAQHETPTAVEMTRSLSIDTAVEAKHRLQLCDSAPMYDSPEQIFQCNGFNCRENTPTHPPIANVISISSSTDAQLTWEDRDGNSMTKALIGFLSENPYPMLTDLLSNISFILHERAIRRHAEAASFRAKLRKHNERLAKKGKPPICPNRPEMINFQVPLLSSERPLPPDQIWDP